MFTNISENVINFQVSQVHVIKEDSHSQNVTVTVEITPDEHVGTHINDNIPCMTV